jgi:hypothetical protein
MFAGGVAICFVHQLDGMLIAIGSILLGAFGFSDAQGVTRLKEFQRQLGVQNHWVELVAGGNVPPAFHQLVLCVHRFRSSLGFLANYILENHDVAGLANRIVRLCSDNQSESLKIGGHVQLAAMIAAQQNFTQVYGPAFRRNRPQDVCQIFIAERRRFLQVAEFRFDRNGSALTVDLGDTIR